MENKKKGGWAGMEASITNIELPNHCQECSWNSKSLKKVTQGNTHWWGIDGINMLDTMTKVQDVVIDLIWWFLKFQRTSSFYRVWTFGSQMLMMEKHTKKHNELKKRWFIFWYYGNFWQSCQKQVPMWHSRIFCTSTGQEKIRAL